MSDQCYDAQPQEPDWDEDMETVQRAMLHAFQPEDADGSKAKAALNRLRARLEAAETERDRAVALIQRWHDWYTQGPKDQSEYDKQRVFWPIVETIDYLHDLLALSPDTPTPACPTCGSKERGRRGWRYKGKPADPPSPGRVFSTSCRDTWHDTPTPKAKP